jgi:ubiquitin C-terminal hydrolase
MFGFNAQFISNCNVCSLESVKEDWQNVWYVHVLPYSTLIEALTASFSNEELDDKNLYICTNCKIKVPSSRKINIIQSSPIIFIILRRFSYDQFSKMTNKIHQFITYPEILNLTPYFDKNIQESIKENDAFNNFTYRLNAVVVHLGKTADSGHIFTYIRAPDGFWYKANDESVTRVKLDKVLADKDAYILCYVKVAIDTVVSTDTELIIPPLQLPSLFTSSTPIRPSKDYNNIINNYTTVRKTFLLSYIMAFLCYI